MTCVRCGSDLRLGARFCPTCGLSLDSQPTVCRYCHYEVTPGTRYCRHCGKPLTGDTCLLCNRPNRPNVKFCAHCGSFLAAAPPEHPYGTGKLPAGIVLAGRYLVANKIAQGGMGAVYEAGDVTQPGIKLAVKEMSFSLLKNLSQEQQRLVIENFRREFDLLSKLHHPNLVRADSFFEEQSRQYFVMEFIEGQTLEAILDNLPAMQLLPVDRVLEWARQLCDVLAYLHAQTPPIIYRDLKPSNIMEVADSQLIKLFDFGIARFYKPGQKGDTLRFGTEGYLAPEILAQHTQTSELTDVYGLGALLHQLFTCHDPQLDPWRRPPVDSINPYVSEQVSNAIARALALDPNQRTPTVEALLKDLFGPEVEVSWRHSHPLEIASVEAPISAPSVSAPVSSQQPLSGAVQVPSAPVSAPSQDVKAVMPESPSSVPVSIPSEPLATSAPLELGSVEKGKIASGTFQVVLPVASTGQVNSSVAWLIPQPDSFTSQDITITVQARTNQLSLSRWQLSTAPGWFVRMPKLFRGWLAFHLNPLVPRPQRHQGEIEICVSNAPVSLVPVGVEVYPSALRTLLGSLAAVSLLAFEAGCLLALILLIIYMLL